MNPCEQILAGMKSVIRACHADRRLPEDAQPLPAESEDLYLSGDSVLCMGRPERGDVQRFRQDVRTNKEPGLFFKHTTSSFNFPISVPAVCNQVCPGGDLNNHKQGNQYIHRRPQGVQYQNTHY